LGTDEEYAAFDRWKKRHPDSDLSFEDVKALYKAAWNASFDVVSSGEASRPANAEELDELVWNLMDKIERSGSEKPMEFVGSKPIFR